MDYLFTKEKPRENEDMDLFGTICDNDLMGDNWTPNNPDDLLDSFFSMNDDLMGFDETKGFDCLDDISAHIKKEAEEYELTSNIDPVFHNYSSQPNGHVLPNTSISSNSSDSGLSSDNLDVEMSPEYEPLSPAISSPGPSISERGANSPTKATIPINIVNATGSANQTTASTKVFTATPNIVKPRVIVQKVPQNFTAVQTAPRTINLAQAEGVKIIKLSPQMFTTSNGKKVTIQLKNSTSSAQLEAQQGTFVLNKKNGTEVKKLIRVQNALNPRSIMLPVSIQDVRGLGNIKIINATSLKKQNSSPLKVNLVVQQPKFKQGEAISTAVNLPVQKEIIKEEPIIVDQNSDGDSFVFDEFYDDDVEETESISYQNESTTESDQPYPKLSLTPEEKRLLAKEGISLPSHFPLTKHEERELKRIRRKIRNKISAQDSRKRKKEYVDGLEERVKQCTEENQTLLKRIKMLQNQNQNLMSQMKKLQSLLSKGTNKTAQPATCLMVLLLSLALVAAPNLNLGRNAKESELAEVVKETILQNRRNLLFDVKDQIANLVDDDFLMDEAQIPSDEALESELVVEQQQPHCKKPKLIFDFDVDDENWYHSKEVQGMQRKSQQNFNSLAEEYQKQKVLKNTQTSGFNIASDPEVSPNLKPLDDRKQIDFFDEDIMDMITKRSEGIYELNLDKMSGIHGDEVVYEIAGAKMIPQKVDMKLNASQMGSFQKY